MTGMYGAHVRESFVGLWNFIAGYPFDTVVILFAAYGAYALYREFTKKKSTTPTQA